MRKIVINRNESGQAITAVGNHIIDTVGCAMEITLYRAFTDKQRAKMDPMMILCVNVDGVTLGTIEKTIQYFVKKYVMDIVCGKTNLSTMVLEIESLTMEYHGD